jgi:YD repeat-containing protein
MTARGCFVLVAASFLLAAWAPRALAVETHQHDALGRLTDVAYDDGSSIHCTYDANGNVFSVVSSQTTGVTGGGSPLQFALGPTTPNPGTGVRNLVFTIPSPGRVALDVFDVTGREVAVLVDRELPAGTHDVRFITDRWAAGVYLYRLRFGASMRKGRFTVLR